MKKEKFLEFLRAVASFIMLLAISVLMAIIGFLL